jgi:hypothetical protein
MMCISSSECQPPDVTSCGGEKHNTKEEMSDVKAHGSSYQAEQCRGKTAAAETRPNHTDPTLHSGGNVSPRQSWLET